MRIQTAELHCRAWKSRLTAQPPFGSGPPAAWRPAGSAVQSERSLEPGVCCRNFFPTTPRRTRISISFMQWMRLPHLRLIKVRIDRSIRIPEPVESFTAQATHVPSRAPVTVLPTHWASSFLSLARTLIPSYPHQSCPIHWFPSRKPFVRPSLCVTASSSQ